MMPRNRCTARQQAATLAWVNRQVWADLFRENLSVAGVDGSLHRQLKAYPNRVYAKTGTMRSVRALTGFVTGPQGPRFAFSVIFNGYPRPDHALSRRAGRILPGGDSRGRSPVNREPRQFGLLA